MRPRISAARPHPRWSISAFGAPLQLQREGHVVGDGHVRVERVVLEHHGDVALLRRQVVDHPLADADLARGDVLEPGDHAQQRRLAAAGRADEDDELAVLDVDRDAVQDRRRAEGLAHVADLDARHVASGLARIALHAFPPAAPLGVRCRHHRRSPGQDQAAYSIATPSSSGGAAGGDPRTSGR